MAAIEIVKYPTSSPADTTPFFKLHEAGYTKDQNIAVIGKTEGSNFRAKKYVQTEVANDLKATAASMILAELWQRPCGNHSYPRMP